MAHLDNFDRHAEGSKFNAEFLHVIAVHEAGHAVVAWSLGVKLNGIRIGPNGGLCVHGLTALPCIDPELMDQRDWKKVELKAQILLGGELAEMIQRESAYLAGDTSIEELFGLAYESSIQATELGSDRQKLRSLAEDVFGGLENAAIDWIRKMEQRAERTLLNNWHRISLLSSALLETHSLTGQQATLILQHPICNWPEQKIGVIPTNTQSEVY